MKAVLFTLSLLFVWGHSSLAYEPDQIVHGSSGEVVSFEQALQQVRPGSVLIVSEIHDLKKHHDNQLVVLRSLRRHFHKISVGMEFLAYPDQDYVHQYLDKKISEKVFLEKVRWGGLPFEWYKKLILFPLQGLGDTLAINAPRSLSGKIAKTGLESLNSQELELLPPNFTLGNELYKKRFKQAVGGHIGDEQTLNNYFAAQSLWDDTMAWKLKSFLQLFPEQILVVIVGDFHVSYGGGLPDRLKARGVENTVVISQVNLEGLGKEEVDQIVLPHHEYGMRADFVWLSKDSRQSQSKPELMPFVGL
jgi:uncharacterized iron-regulated protein